MSDVVISPQNNQGIDTWLKWENDGYKRGISEDKPAMIDKDGRPLADPYNDKYGKTHRITHSEAVSYALLRAVIMDDHETFDKVWHWAQTNMQRKNIKTVFNADVKQWWDFSLMDKNDNLFAWRWTPDIDGKTGGVDMSSYDYDPALDADQDIAAALLMAHQKWGSGGKYNYYGEARLILNDIWCLGTEVVNGERVLLAGDNFAYTRDPKTGERTFGVDPSYLRPYYYKTLFAKYDPKEESGHDWASMVNSSYKLIAKAQRARVLNENKKEVVGSSGWTADFAALNKNGDICGFAWNYGQYEKTKDYYAGGDSFRLLFWMALEVQMNPGDKEAQKYFANKAFDPRGTDVNSMYPFLKSELEKHNGIFNSYNIDGTSHWTDQTLQTKGVYMAYLWTASWFTGDDKSAATMWTKLHYTVDKKAPGTGYWECDPQDYYYGENWAWFSFALINGELAKNLKVKTTDENGNDFIKKTIADFKKSDLAKEIKEKHRTPPTDPVSVFRERPLWFTKYVNWAGGYDWIAGNVNCVFLADFFKSYNALDESEKEINLVLEQKWATYQRSVVKTDEAEKLLAGIYIAKADKINDEMNKMLDNNPDPETTKGLEAVKRDYILRAIDVIKKGMYGPDYNKSDAWSKFRNFAKGLRSGEKSYMASYCEEMLGVVYYAKKLQIKCVAQDVYDNMSAEKKNKAIVMSPDELENYYYGATFLYNQTQGKYFDDNFIALDAMVFYADYLSGGGPEQQEEGFKINKRALAYIRLLSGNEIEDGKQSMLCPTRVNSTFYPPSFEQLTARNEVNKIAQAKGLKNASLEQLIAIAKEAKMDELIIDQLKILKDMENAQHPQADWDSLAKANMAYADEANLDKIKAYIADDYLCPVENEKDELDIAEKQLSKGQFWGKVQLWYKRTRYNVDKTLTEAEFWYKGFRLGGRHHEIEIFTQDEFKKKLFTGRWDQLFVNNFARDFFSGDWGKIASHHESGYDPTALLIYEARVSNSIAGYYKRKHEDILALPFVMRSDNIVEQVLMKDEQQGNITERSYSKAYEFITGEKSEKE